MLMGPSGQALRILDNFQRDALQESRLELVVRQVLNQFVRILKDVHRVGPLAPTALVPQVVQILTVMDIISTSKHQVAMPF